MAGISLTWLDAAQRRTRHVAIGEFDGVHRGHRALLAGVDTVLTFDPHPLAVVAPHRAPKLLTRLDVRAEILAELGVQEVVVVPFEPAFAAKRAEDFVVEDLVDRIGAVTVSVGRNFRFGRGARADVGVLERHPAVEARVVELVEAEGEVVSSTRIRGLVADGHLEQANALLERPFELPATIDAAAAGGAGVLAAVDPRLLHPPTGRYACRVRDPGGTWRDVDIDVPDGDLPAPRNGSEHRVRFLRRLL